MAGKNLGSLVFDIQADVASLRKSMAQAETTVKKSTSRMEKSAKKARTALKNIGTAVAAGAGVASAAILGVVNRQRDLIDSQAKMASALGFTSKQLAGYRLGAELSGLSTSQFESATTRFIKSIGDAGNGLQAPTRALKALGLEFDDLNGKSTDEQIQIVADRFGTLEGTVAKNTVAMDLFGRSGSKVLKMFENGAAGIKSFQQEAKDLGIAVSDLDAKKVEDMNDAFTRAKQAVSGISTQLTITLAPVLEEMANDFATAAKESGGFKQEIENIKEVAELASDSLKYLLDLREKINSAQEWVKNDLSTFDNSGRDSVINAEEINEGKLNKALEKREILLTTMLGLSKEAVAEREKELAILNKEISARQASKEAYENSSSTWQKIREMDANSASNSQLLEEEKDQLKKAKEAEAAAAAIALAESTKKVEDAMESFKEALDSAREAVNASGPKLTAENVQYRDLARLTGEARIASAGGDQERALKLAEEGAKAAQLLKETGKESGLVISGALKSLEAIASKASAHDKQEVAEPKPAKGELTIEIRGNTYQFTGNDTDMKEFVVKAVEDALTFSAAEVGA